MKLNEMKDLLRESGVVGAGGAGFPSYAKLAAGADTVILNCSECEPLLKLHRQLLARYSKELLMTLEEIVEALGADRAIVAVKEAYTETVDAINAVLADFPKVQLSLMKEFYPAGDEVITVYETTGRVVAPGELPISVGCIVYNVETVYNVYRAWKDSAPVTHKFVTVAGEVQNPCTVKAPLGISYGELITMVGGSTLRDFAIISGGPMTGRVATVKDVVTKTTNAILVLPKNAYVVQKKLTPLTISINRVMAACCQCQMCTDLCSRHLLGHPIEPHKLMRAVASGVATDGDAFLGAFSCSSCGLCEMYSCGQGLNPAGIIAATKNELRKNGVTPPKGGKVAPVEPTREYRKISVSRLTARLGLTQYELPAPLIDVNIEMNSAKINLSQGIGALATPVVTVGQTVAVGDTVADVEPEKLGTAIHASIGGIVTEVTDAYIIIQKTTKSKRKDGVTNVQ